MTSLSGTLAILPKLTVNGSIAHGSMVMPDTESFQAYHLGASNVVAIYFSGSSLHMAYYRTCFEDSRI